MSKFPLIARYLLGTILLVFGLNGFLNFLPAPELPEAAGAFFGALIETGYMMHLVKSVEVIVAVLLLSNRFVPLALVMLVPISINILAFHLVLAPAGIGPGALVFILNIYLLFVNIDSYRPMLKANA